MPLGSGTRLGPYEILSALGAGGMGEVYRATDTSLGRQVAIKVLPDAFAQDEERLARFEREAKTLASLNHPHIAQIYGLEKSSGVQALVMELVEGEDLSQRIARGPIPIDEALPIARQIAEALEVAHEQGIIHRDLKPANIKVTPDGNVKVLDFGLAKFSESAGSSRPTSGAALSLSPTITSPAMMTGIGVLLGTAAYMSPEQAKGRPADKRSDIWGFGCVLFEMLSGRSPFAGTDVSETLAFVITRPPAWEVLPPQTPPAIRRLLERALRKNPATRLQHVGDARIELDDAMSGAEAASSSTATPGAGARPWARTLALSAAAFAVGTVSGIIITRAAFAPVVAGGAISLAITPPLETALAIDPIDHDFAVTPDGTRVVYISSNRGSLVVRALDRVEPQVLVRDAVALRHPFMSPDGEWIGYFDGPVATLKKIPIGGGTPIAICDVPGRPHGGTWGPDDTIIFSTDAASSGLMQVPASGGMPHPLTKLAGDEASHFWPRWIPQTQQLLFTVLHRSSDTDVDVLSLDSGARKVLVPHALDARYLAPGYLIYGAIGPNRSNSMTQGAPLEAAAFDLASLRVTGGAAPLLTDVLAKAQGAYDFDISSSGTLAYVAGSIAIDRSLVWVARDGKVQAITNIGGLQAARPRLSPDGRRAVVQIITDLWLYDLDRGTRTRLTFDGGSADAVWTPDGKRIAFGDDPMSGTDTDIYWMPWDGSEKPIPLLTGKNAQDPYSWSPDGRTLAYYERNGSNRDLWVLGLDPRPTPRPVLVTPFNERSPFFSPDGKWLAYASDEAGRDEIYIRSLTPGGGRYVLSTDGGTEPIWSANGREVFYRNGDAVMSVAVQVTPAVSIGVPRMMFSGPYARESGGSGSLGYDVTRDGQRFLMIKQANAERESSGSVPINVITGLQNRLRAPK